jgi:hypothetical protein
MPLRESAADKEMRDRLNARYREEGWGVLAEKAGYEPFHTESAARDAFRWAWDEIVEREAELIYLRLYGSCGAVWSANQNKEIWREKARAVLRSSQEERLGPRPR